MSAGVAGRPRRMPAEKSFIAWPFLSLTPSSINCSSSVSHRGVSTTPGAKLLTVMSCLANSRAPICVMAATPNLLTLYGTTFGSRPALPTIEPVLTIFPASSPWRPWRIICLAASCMPTMTPQALTPITKSQFSFVVSRKCCGLFTPALLNITSRRPQRSTAAAITAAVCSRLRTSTAVPNASPPNASAAAWAASLAPASFMSAKTTLAPSLTSVWPMARPMPCAAPVTTTTFPSARPMADLPSLLGRTSGRAGGRTCVWDVRADVRSALRGVGRILPVDQELPFGHVLDRAPEPLATEAGGLHAAVRHVVDAERRHVTDDQAAHLQAVEGALDQVVVVREQTRLQPEVGVVQARQGVVRVAVAEQRQDRAEDLFAHDLLLLVDVAEDGGAHDGAVDLASGQDGRSGVRGFLEPRLDPFRRGAVDDRSDVGGGVHRIAGHERPDACGQGLGERVVHVVVDEHALHRDARLPAVREAAPDDPLHGAVQVGVAMHQRAGVAAELQRDALAAGAALEHPAHAGRAGEREQRDAVVLDERRGVLDLGRDDREAVVRPACGQDRAAQQHRRGGRAGVGPEHDGIAGGHGGRQLVGDEVQGVVERRDGRDGRASCRERVCQYV